MCKYVWFQVFLKRLESVKPTPGMTRDEQLADYQQQCRYMGTYNTDIPPVKLKSSETSGTFLHTTYKFKPQFVWSTLYNESMFSYLHVV